MSERALAFFGAGWLRGGRIDVKLARPIYPGDTVSVRAVITGKAPEGDAMRLTLDIWLENQDGERVTVGSASGLTPYVAERADPAIVPIAARAPDAQLSAR